MNLGLKRQEPWPAGVADWGIAAAPAPLLPVPPPEPPRTAVKPRSRSVARPLRAPRPRIRPDLVDLSETREMSALMACVRSMMRERPQLVLHVIAAAHGEGTSSIARGLARRAAQEPWCSTLLLDATDAAAAAPARGHQRSASGAHDGLVLFRDREQERLRWATLSADASGAIPLDLGQLYDDLRAQFNLVVVDCASIEAMPDGAALASLADGVMLVAAAEQTRVAVIEHAKAVIAKSGGRILGIVLNRRRDYIPQFLYRHL
jgi:Mrp family chromosome partitioning ATPase